MKAKLWKVTYQVSRNFQAWEITEHFATEKQARTFYKKVCKKPGFILAGVKHLIEDNIAQVISRVMDPLSDYMARIPARKRKEIRRQQEKYVRKILEEVACRI